MLGPLHISPSSYASHMAGGCCPLTSPSSTPPQPSKLGWDNSPPQVKCWWPSGSDMGSCSHPVASPQGTPEMLPLVWWRHSAEPVYNVLAHFQPRWLKGQQVRSCIQCQRRMCDNTYLFAKQDVPSPLLYPCSKILDISPWSLVQSTTTPPRSGSLEVSVTQILRKNNQASPMAKEPFWRPASCSLFRTRTSLLHLPILQTFKLQQRDVQG